MKEIIIIEKEDSLSNEDFLVLQSQAVEHLKGVSNQKCPINIKDFESIIVCELIPEVEKLSPIGRAYLEEFNETMIFVKNLGLGGPYINK